MPHRLHTSGLTLEPGLNLAELAESCHGYSGADLAALAREAAMHALSETARQLLARPWSPGPRPHWEIASGAARWVADNVCGSEAVGVGSVRDGGKADLSLGFDKVAVVTAGDFAAAMRHVGPSIARGAEVEVQPVRVGYGFW